MKYKKNIIIKTYFILKTIKYDFIELGHQLLEENLSDLLM